MAVGGQLAVDGLAQVKVADDSGGRQVKDLLDSLHDLLVGNGAGAEGVHHDGDGLCHADGIGQLDLALGSQARGNHVFGDPAGGIRGGTVHLAGVLAAERTAAVAGIAAVGVHDDFAACQAGVALRAAHNKAARGVDVILRVLVQQLGGNDLLNDLAADVLMQLLLADVGAVLAGNDHRVDAHGLAVVVLHGDLALAVRAQVIQRAVLAHLGQALGQLMGQADGQRHQLGRLVAGVAEHHALVARTGHVVVGAQRNVGTLAVDVGDDAAGVAVKAVLGAVIADGADDLARRAGDVHVAVGRDLAHDVDKTGGAGRLAGNAGAGVLRQDGVEDGVGDLVADFVGMPLGDGFGREKNFGHWGKPPIKYSAETQPWKQKARSRKDCAR